MPDRDLSADDIETLAREEQAKLAARQLAAERQGNSAQSDTADNNSAESESADSSENTQSADVDNADNFSATADNAENSASAEDDTLQDLKKVMESRSEKALEKIRTAEKSQEQESAPENTSPQKSAETSADEIVEATPLTFDQDQAEAYADYVEMIRSGSRLSPISEPYKKTTKGKKGPVTRFYLEIRGKGGRAQIFDQKLWPLLNNEYQRVLAQEGDAFFKDAPQAPPEMVRTRSRGPVMLTPEQISQDKVFPVMKLDPSQPLISSLIEKTTWMESALYDIGWQTILVVLQSAKIPVEDLYKSAERFRNKEDFVAFVLSYQAALVKNAGDVNGIQRLEQKIKALETTIELAKVLLERYEKEKNESYRQIAICVASMCPADAQRYMNARIMTDIGQVTGSMPDVQELVNGVDNNNNGGKQLLPDLTQEAMIKYLQQTGSPGQTLPTYDQTYFQQRGVDPRLAQRRVQNY